MNITPLLPFPAVASHPESLGAPERVTWLATLAREAGASMPATGDPASLHGLVAGPATGLPTGARTLLASELQALERHQPAPGVLTEAAARVGRLNDRLAAGAVPDTALRPTRLEAGFNRVTVGVLASRVVAGFNTPPGRAPEGAAASATVRHGMRQGGRSEPWSMIPLQQEAARGGLLRVGDAVSRVVGERVALPLRDGMFQAAAPAIVAGGDTLVAGARLGGALAETVDLIGRQRPVQVALRPAAAVSGTVGAGWNLGRAVSEPVTTPLTAIVQKGGIGILAATTTGLGLGATTGSLHVGTLRVSDARTPIERFVARSANSPPKSVMHYMLAGSPDGASALVTTMAIDGAYSFKRALLPGQSGSPLQFSSSFAGTTVRASDTVGVGLLGVFAQVANGPNLRLDSQVVATVGRSEYDFTTVGSKQPADRGSLGARPVLNIGFQTGPFSLKAQNDLSIGAVRVSGVNRFTPGNLQVSVGLDGVHASVEPINVRSYLSMGVNAAFVGVGEPNHEGL